MIRRLGLVLGVTLLLIGGLYGQANLARIFDHHMVLQRDEPVRIWGYGKPGWRVEVRFSDQTHEAVVDETGEWFITLEPLVASSEGRDLIFVSRGVEATLRDVVVGDVWICGGQSNMAWTLRGSRDADLEIPCARDDGLRFIRLPREARGEPRRDFERRKPDGSKGWRACTPATAGECTAVGYYFGRRLRRHLGVPIGLIDVSWGGTMAQHWVSKPRLREIPAMKPFFDTFEKDFATWVADGREEGARRRFEEALAAWEKEAEAAKAAGKRVPGRPRAQAFDNPAHKRHPGGMYDGMMFALRGLRIRGALFYQGENNSFGESWKPFPETYPAVIAEWRDLFGKPDLPMGLIQIAGWSNRRTMTYDMNHHTNVVREVQFDTWQRTENTGLIVTFDANSNGNIHPGHKRPVGERTARWALSEVYGVTIDRGKPLPWRGPVYESMAIDGKNVAISFAEGTRQGLRLDKDTALGFYVAGEDRTFHVAEAKILKGERVHVWCDDVPSPVAVRYAWSNLPLGSLMNGRDLPAYPFRTDDWPLMPHRSEGEYHRRR